MGSPIFLEAKISMKQRWSKILYTFIVLGAVEIVSSLTGCGSNPANHKIVTIGEQKVYEDEWNYYAYCYVKEYNIVDASLLETEYEAGYTYNEKYKDDILAEIEEVKILYVNALKAGITLSEADEALINEQAEGLMAEMTQEEMNAYGIDIELVTQIVTQQYYGELLKEQVLADASAEIMPYSHTYNLLFCTVELGEDGLVKTEEDGTFVTVSETEKERQLALATEAKDKLESGADIEKLVEAYEIQNVSGDLYGNETTFFPAYYEAVETLKDGEISDVVETPYGYNVFVLIAKEDASYTESIQSLHDTRDSITILEEKMEEWRLNAGAEEVEKEEKAWENLTLATFLQ